MTFGQRLRAARKAAGLLQKDIADACGIRELAVSQWESGYSTPRADRIVPAATALGVDPGWLLTGDGDATPRKAGRSQKRGGKA